MTEAVPDKNAVRQLKIKTGVLKRSVKDHTSYSNELAEQKTKLETMAASGAD